jgi:hypothetical protein
MSSQLAIHQQAHVAAPPDPGGLVRVQESQSAVAGFEFGALAPTWLSPQMVLANPVEAPTGIEPENQRPIQLVGLVGEGASTASELPRVARLESMARSSGPNRRMS